MGVFEVFVVVVLLCLGLFLVGLGSFGFAQIRNGRDPVILDQ